LEWIKRQLKQQKYKEAGAGYYFETEYPFSIAFCRMDFLNGLLLKYNVWIVACGLNAGLIA